MEALAREVRSIAKRCRYQVACELEDVARRLSGAQQAGDSKGSANAGQAARKHDPWCSVLSWAHNSAYECDCSSAAKDGA